MRPIKFRAWSMSADHWVMGTEFVIHTTGNILNIPEHVTLEQSTGIVDRNGREIYEGDILGLDDPEDQSRCVVVWHNVALKPQLVSNAEYPVFASDWDWIVIGNIHETPELAKKAEESEE